MIGSGNPDLASEDNNGIKVKATRNLRPKTIDGMVN